MIEQEIVELIRIQDNAGMAALAEKRGVNCSQVLQDGLMQIFRLPQNYNA